VESHFVDFAVLLGVLALAVGVSMWLRLPVVPFYIVAGVLLGGLLEPSETVEFLGTLGVVFLLFSLGLEFSVGGLVRDVRGFLGAGSIDWLFNFPIGLLAGWALGFSWVESLFLAGIVYMSSSAVVTKCIVEFGRAARPETETILKVMVFEDFVIAGYLVGIQSLLAGVPGEFGFGMREALGLLRSFAFVVVLIVIARSFHRPIERLLAARSDEAFTLVLCAFVLGVAAAAIAAGLSEAIGAFLAGLVLGATSLKERAARTLLPFQTLFAALFFVSFGMRIDLGAIVGVALPAFLLIALGLTTKTLGGFVAARVAGHRAPQALVVGASLVPKGEFSVVLAGLAASAAGPASNLEALVGVYVFSLSILGPLGMREVDRLQEWLLPGGVETR
jgi:CPA2 family monovalent cation:H+ antiporter-2